MFSAEVTKHLKYYVYRLIDPRNGQTFYVGKGKGNRVFAHAKGERGEASDDSDDVSDKLRRIREIHNDSFDVTHVIHRHGLDEETALEVEAALIDAYPEAANKVAGHHSGEHGIMHVNQVIEQYEAKEIDFQHKVIMITVNHSAVDRDSVYEAAQHAWKLDVNRARQADLVLAMRRGIVVDVFVPTEWLDATKANFPNRDDAPGRWGFIGEPAAENIRKLYRGTRLPEDMRKQGAANPIRYSPDIKE